MRTVGLLLMLGLPTQYALHGALPAGYYDSAVGETGNELKSALHEIINNHHVIPYSSSSFDTQDAMEVIDQDPNNSSNVILIYSRRSEPKINWPDWNREHLWPNSYGIDSSGPAYSDLHNLRPADMNVNSSRGNEYFDWSDTNSSYYVFPAHPEAPLCSSDEDSWEPPDVVKGDIARAQFYMAVRYEGDVSNERDLELTEDTAAIDSATNLMGRLSTLLQWNRLDPVDAAEEARNEGVYGYQGNRNPFVDHPEWVEAVFIPTLTISTTPTHIRLRWENTGTTFVLETADGLDTGWSTEPTAPTLDAQGWYVDVVSDGGQRFYRLRL